MKTFNKLAFVFGTVIITLLAGCSSDIDESTTEASKDVSVTFVEESGDADKYIASLSIDGMACEMACGSKISGTLAALTGVKNTSIEFNGAEEENFALVEYDANEISEKEMISAIEGLNNGHYSVKAVKVTHFTKSKAAEDQSEKVGAVNQSFDYDLPNFFSIFTRIF